jgi:hypothetical protein
MHKIRRREQPDNSTVAFATGWLKEKVTLSSPYMYRNISDVQQLGIIYPEGQMYLTPKRVQATKRSNDNSLTRTHASQFAGASSDNDFLWSFIQDLTDEDDLYRSEFMALISNRRSATEPNARALTPL